MRFISIRKKSLIIIAAITFIFIFVSISCAGVIANKKVSSSNYSYTVVIDPGHGGIDAGAIGINTKVKESDLNLKVAFLLKEKFESYGIKVVLTRKTKDSLANPNVRPFKREDMKLRKEIITEVQPNFILSIHMNKYSLKSRRGAQTFFKDTESSKALAECIQSSLNFNINKPYLKRDFTALYGDYYMLKCTNFNAVIIECGFLSNPEDEKLLLKDYYLDELTYSIFSACIGYIAMQNNL